MHDHHTGDEASVKMSTRHRFGARQASLDSKDHRRDIAAGAVLQNHWSARILTAIIIATLQLGLSHRADTGVAFDRTTAAVLATVAGYALYVTAIVFAVRIRRRAQTWLVSAALLGDLLCIFALTLAAVAPEHYERALFGTIVVMHVANFFFGRLQVWRVAQIGIVGYIGLIAAAVTAHQGGRRRRGVDARAVRGGHVADAPPLWQRPASPSHDRPFVRARGAGRLLARV